MKKILILPILFLTLLGCSKSKNDEVITSNTTPTELIGTWKFVGYYDDMAIGTNNNNFHLVSDGFTINYNTDGNCYSTANIYYTNGTYTLSNNSILTTSYISSTNNTVSSGSELIYKLTSSELILQPLNTQLTFAYKYEKVVTTPTVTGKK